MGDFFLDPGITVKQEPISENSMNISASVPIPAKRLDFDYHFDLESQSPLYQDLLGQLQSPELETNTMWGMKIDMDVTNKGETLMDDDDIFQVDKADLIQGPTLAELNANDENLLADLNFDDLLLPDENTYNYINGINISQSGHKYSTSFVQINNNSGNHLNNNTMIASSCPQPGLGYYKDLDFMSSCPYDSNKTNISAFSPTSQASSNSSLVYQTPPSPGSGLSSIQQKHSTLHELLKRDNYHSPERYILAQSVPGPSSPAVAAAALRMHRLPHSSRLSSSAPTHLGLEQIWQRREPRKHLLSTGSLAEAGSTSSISTGGVLSPDAQELSHDELDSDEDSDHYEDFSSENESDEEDEHGNKQLSTSKKERYFWQYNVQAKGPKGQRLILKTKTENPHVLNEVTDPVFSPDCAVRGIKHSGKARKGDGNDLTPNPRKLYSIGKELDKLGRIINDMTPVSELPFNVRPKTRKEKNKLASRACRLKKKAQHEANKIKLQGLETEHKRLMNGIFQSKQIFSIKLNNSTPEKQDELTNHLDKISKSATKVKIAGQTTDYVNKILDKAKNGGIHITMDDYMYKNKPGKAIASTIRFYKLGMVFGSRKGKK